MPNATRQKTEDVESFVRWLYPKEAETILPHYRALAERLRGRTGQFVLMIEREEKSHGGCVRDLGPPIKESFSLGVLEDDRLLLERTDAEAAFGRGKLSFPTKRFVASSVDAWSEPYAEDGAMRPFIWDTLFFHKTDRPMTVAPEEGGCFGSPGIDTDFCLGAERDRPMSELQFVIGNAELEAWCRSGAMHVDAHGPNGARCDLVRKLARALDAPTDRIFAMRVDAETKRNATLARLYALLGTRDELVGKLEDPDGRDDVRELVRELRGVRPALKTALKRADELDLGNEPTVKRVRKMLETPAK